MELQLTEKEIEDLRTALVIAIHAEDNDRTKRFFDRIEKIMNKLDEARGLYPIDAIAGKETQQKRSVSEKILSMYLARFLRPELSAGNMIAVFDIVEHNPDGISRLKRLIEDECVIELSRDKFDQAVELLNDYPSVIKVQI